MQLRDHGARACWHLRCTQTLSLRRGDQDRADRPSHFPGVRARSRRRDHEHGCGPCGLVEAAVRPVARAAGRGRALAPGRDRARVRCGARGVAMKGWELVYDGYEPAQEGVRETLCTLGNGYFATRGAAHEVVAGSVHYPGTYITGCYNRLSTEIGGRLLEHEDLVNMPNWLLLTYRHAGGEWFELAPAEILS